MRRVFGLVLLGLTVAGYGQHPRQLDRSFQRPGARALGLGGAYLLATDDATATIWNPAALAHVPLFTVPVEVAGRSNFDIRDFQDLVDALKTIRDQIGQEVDPQSLGASVRKVQSLALKRGAVSGQITPATLRASLAPLLGLNLGGFGIALTAGILGEVEVFVNQRIDPDPNDAIPASSQPQNIYARGGLISLTSLGVGWARRSILGLSWGITLRGIRADFLAFATSAGVDNLEDPSDGDSQGIPYDRVNTTRFTVDFGFLWEPPLQPPKTRIRYAAVIRNLIPVRFPLPSVDLQGESRPPGNFNFRLNPEVDLGLLATVKGGQSLFVLEVHNITSSNGGEMSLHAGIEHHLFQGFALRVGWDNDRMTFGAGFSLGFLTIDVATGLKPQERLALGLRLHF